MQSTEEYLDQLLASVSDEDNHNDSNTKSNTKARKSIEDLDESELTEEALQKHLALLLGLETEEDMDFDDEPEDNFMSQYAAQMSFDEVESFDTGVQELPDESIQPVLPESVVMDLPAEEPVVSATPEPAVSATSAVSDSGVLSPDEIAALFASMEAETESEPELADEGAPETEAGVIEVPEPEPVVVTPAAPVASDSGVLSPDEIASLFASMGADDSEHTSENDETDVTDEVLLGKSKGSEEEHLSDMSGALTREELEELGLGDIADVLVDGEQEILSENTNNEAISIEEAMEVMSEFDSNNNEEGQIVEIPDFDFGEEMLLELENVDAMLEATAKMAEEEIVHTDADSMAEEDIMAMLNQFEEESIQESIAAQEASEKAAEEAVNKALEEETQPDTANAEEAGAKKKGKKAKKEKVKKEKVKKEKPAKEKKDKASLKDKIVAFMFEDESLDDGKIPLGDSEELSYMDLPVEEKPIEEKPVKKKKEKASKKDKKAQKASSGKPKDENAEIAAELAAEDKKKAKKKEKPKKEKKVKKVVITDASASEAGEKSSKRGIGTKGIVATLLVCASLLGLILVGTYFVPKQLSLIMARTAFYAQDYEETTMRLMGKDLNDSDRILYDKASLLYGLEERYHQSEIYLKSDMTKEALNSLLQGVVACNKEEVLANQLGIDTEWSICKERFMLALQEQYGLDAETVEAICALRNPDYTVAVENILAGRMYDDKSEYGGEASDSVATNNAETQEDVSGDDEEEVLPGGLNPDEMEDLLPEEEAIIQQMQQEDASQNVQEETSETENNELYSGSVEGGAVNFVE